MAAHTAIGDRNLVIRDLTSIQIFASVVETQSFSQTARRLGMTPSTVSKHIGALEDRLGARLVNRTTRRISITENGTGFYDRCINVLQELEAAETEILQLTQEPKGLLRVTAPNVLTTRHISPFLPEFLRRYPEMRLDFLLTSRTIDMVEEGVDLSIRLASEVNPQLHSEVLAPNRRVFCAAPEYLEKHGVPKKPDDLLEHNCLIARTVQLLNTWLVTEGGRVRSLRVSGNLIANNVDILRDALVGGLGIANVGTFVVGDDLKSGRLVPILQDYTVQNSWFFAVVPHRRHVPLKSRVFIDFLKETFGPVPYWDEIPPNSAFTG